MGRYSYSQPSSSDEVDFDYLIEEEAQLYMQESERNFNRAEQNEYLPSPEADEGIPRVCYCGGVPVTATAYTEKDPGRRYYMCEHVDDGYCHIWKWWDVAVTEEISEMQRQQRLLKDQGFELDQKMLKVQKQLAEVNKSLSEVKKSVCDQQKSVSEVEKKLYEQQKSLWEDNMICRWFLLFMVTVTIGVVLMFISGRLSNQ